MKFKNILKKINWYAVIGIPTLIIGGITSNIPLICIGFCCAVLDMGNSLQRLYEEKYKNEK